VKPSVERVVTAFMKNHHYLRTGLAAVVAALAAGGLFAQDHANRIEVRFLEPENFTDVRDGWGSDFRLEAYLAEFREYLENRAARFLPPGQKLSVTFTDIDLAGGFEPWHGPRYHDVRIVKDLYPPRMSLQFRLTDADGVVIKEGSRKLRDMAFLMSPNLSHDPLRHEKEMLDDWLRSELRQRA
jgi:hypothetical protein